MIGRIGTSSLLTATLALVIALAFPFVAHAEDEGVAEAAGATSVDVDEQNVVDPTQRADNSFIYDTTIEDILGETAVHDGRIVQFVGEAVGDRIIADPRGKYCWITVESMADGSDANISVYMTVEQAAQIDHFGRYGVTGTTLQVRGTFNQACTEHEGLVDVHADDVAVIAKGLEHPDTFEADNLGLGLLLIILGGVLMGVFYFARERLR